MPLLTITSAGLYCEAGDFYIDPWLPVERAVITHAHSDHARSGMGRYLCASIGLAVLRTRVGEATAVDTLEYGQAITVNGVKLSLHPAGHILGSSQVRLEDSGEVWVVSGDYKTEADRTCQSFEPIKCNTLITESTFGLPIYRWRPQADLFEQINNWWRQNQERGKASVVYCYTLGKAQRLLGGIDPSVGPIFVHGAIKRMNEAYRWAGIELPPATLPTLQPKGYDWSQALILAPPSASGTSWMRRFGDASTAFASGWMQVRGTRRRRAVDRGFVLSDHVDWPSLLTAIEATGAERVLVTHGFANVVSRYLSERGKESRVLPTKFVGEQDNPDEDENEDVEE